ncbi:anti-sigma-D factor RsdA [Mycobacterium sp. 050134]|uniref:anti-sigma-D factor RsdA n=1 Tax=Mycobacterium sp. 050134 TaxID=3096111 RepID=UPI002ED7740C
MPEFGYSFGDQPALDEVAQTDLLLDALAERRPVRLEDPDEDVLATLLEDWRDNLRWPPASALVAPEEAIRALHDGLTIRRRGRRGLATVGSVAAALLVLSGFSAMVVEARPGDTLYGLHAMFFDQPRVNENQIMLSAKAHLAKVQQMIDDGQWDQAHNQLAEVSSTVQSMNDGADRHDLIDQVNLLNTRVESRNPNATLPPAASTTGSWTPTPAPSSAPTPTPEPSASPSPSVPASPSTSPSSGRQHHHHHGQTTSPVAPATDP